MNNKNQYLCILIMGLPGSGKTTVGKILSKQLKAVFIDADDHHSTYNIRKMSNGHPLTDLDRKKWLLSILNKARENLKSQNVVIACSALKEKYRKSFISLNFKLVYLKIEHNVALDRILKRKKHFMPPSLLESQIKILEEPKKALEIDSNLKVNQISEIIVKKFFLN
ncbi:MAG: gluconokinase [Alphaproteobacteria bacterium]|nr:MAG: gluconokinase [Alphaproteobacteria bacterium]